MPKPKVRVRIAPSPTGPFHIGSARTALFNWLFARKNGGQFILRFEDTDQSRNTKESEKDIMEGLQWLGLNWDEGPFYQMERLKIYQKYTQELLEKGKAYKCFCTEEELEKERKEQEAKGLPPKYSGKCRKLSESEIQKAELGKKKYAIRFKINPGKVEFNDIIRGPVSFDTGLFGDPIIMRSDGMPIFLLSNVVDDYEMGITHVIRGEEHLSNAPKQILLQQALDFPTPQYAHIPLILNPDRSKMSKRRDPVSITKDFRDRGYLPEAMINFMVLLGWAPSRTQDIFSINELVETFELNRVGKSGSIFDIEKLNYLNGYYIRQKSVPELVDLIKKDTAASRIMALKNSEFAERVVTLVRERLVRLDQFSEIADYFYEVPTYKKELLIFGKSDQGHTLKGLKKAFQALKKIKPRSWKSINSLEKCLADVVKVNKLSNGDVFWPVRAALSGREASPSPAELLWALGREESLMRIRRGIEKLK